MHGVTKPITFTLTGGKKAEFPKGAFRTGYSTELTLKRSDFDMTKFAEALGDEVTVAISFQGVKK
jgi:polyisoprenoid-binding protein YceI